MKLLSILIGLLLSTSSQAIVFNGDSRIEAQLEAPDFWMQIARSVPALVPKERLTKVPGGWKLDGPTVKEVGRLCEDERFVDQKVIANCSASLIGNDTILSSAHCFTEDHPGRRCQDYAVVFDYALTQKDDPYFIPDENMYFCEEMIYYNFAKDFSEDIMTFRLDRPVQGRELIKLKEQKPELGDELTMIGYPLGIFQKYVDGGVVRTLEHDRLTFKHNLDTFSVNSGGPVFDASTGEQVGVLVRGTGMNFQKKPQRDCSRWGVAKDGDFAEANFITKVPAILYEENKSF